MRTKLVVSILVAMALAVSTGCSSSSSSTPPVVSISAVSPATATVRPGQTQQFSATVTGSSNTAITWSIGSGQGTISSSGLYTAPASPTPGSVTVTATAQADTTKSSAATVTLVALQSLTISPRGPAITVGGNVAFTASGMFVDAGNNLTKADWTANTTWTSSNGDVTIASGTSTATGVSAGVAVLTATDAVGGTVFDTTAVNVTSMNMTNANLSGQYAFTLTHAGQRGQAYVTGSFTADGNGNVTGGIEDLNAYVGSATALVISSGSYTVYPDGRGTLTLNTARGPDVYSFILSTATNGSGASTKGRIIVSSTGSVAAGTLELQDTTATLGVGNNYALLMGGMDGALLSGGSSCDVVTTSCVQDAIVLAGQFSVPSANHISGSLDINDNGTNSASQAFTATFVAPDVNGRGTLAVPSPSPLSATTTLNFAYYVVSASKVLLLQTDLQGSSYPTIPALSGTAELQTFTTTAIAGNSYVFLLERSAAEGLFSDAGEWNFLAANALTGEMDVNCLTGCATTTKNYASLVGSTYTNVAVNGRGTVNLAVGGSFTSAVFYLVSDEKIYVLEADTKPDAGVAELQTNTSSPLSGILAFNFAQLATNGFDSTFIGQIVTTEPLGIVDSNIATNCSPTSTSCVVTEHADTMSSTFNGAVSGRGTATIVLPSQTTNMTYGYYLVSPTKMVVFGINSNVAGFQAIDGVIENQ